MKTLQADSLSEESLVDKAISLLFRWVLESGPPTCLEGRFASEGEEVEWTRRCRNQVDTQRMPARIFRSVMARLYVLSEASDPYGSVATFGWQSDRATYYFRLFFCNEPSMDFWLRLYLYGKSQDWDSSDSAGPRLEAE